MSCFILTVWCLFFSEQFLNNKKEKLNISFKIIFYFGQEGFFFKKKKSNM